MDHIKIIDADIEHLPDIDDVMQGEQYTTGYRVNYQRWIREFGPGVLRLHIINSHPLREISLVDDGEAVLWVLAPEDTENFGKKIGQFTYEAESGAVKKSDLFSVMVKKSL